MATTLQESQVQVFDYRLQVPSRIVIIANSSCGKTWLILYLIEKQMFDKIYFVYTSKQSIFDEFSEKHPHVIFTTEVPGIPKDNIKNTLVGFDDFLLQHESKDNHLITDYFIRLSHHLKVTVICSWQTLFPKNLKTVSNNATYLIIFPLKRDISSIDILNRQMFPDHHSFLRASMKDVSKTKYSFMLVNCSASQHQDFRVRNFVYPIQDSKVYMPKSTTK
jgi:GTPase SAR1 family protein